MTLILTQHHSASLNMIYMHCLPSPAIFTEIDIHTTRPIPHISRMRGVTRMCFWKDGSGKVSFAELDKMLQHLELLDPEKSTSSVVCVLWAYLYDAGYMCLARILAVYATLGRGDMKHLSLVLLVPTW